MSFTVAIDGPAAAGKGTLAKQLAAHFSMAHLDTGLLYRAVARQVLAGSDPVAAAVSLYAANSAALVSLYAANSALTLLSSASVELCMSS